MNFNKIKLFFLIIANLSFMLGMPHIAQANCLYDEHPYSLTYYYGLTYSDSLARMVRGEFHRFPEHINSAELSMTLSPKNPIRHFFHSIIPVVQLAANGAVRSGHEQPKIYEFDPYLAFRWTNFPWQQTLNTSFAIGEGISYTSSIPVLEKKFNDRTKRLLNYLMFEVSLAHPRYPNLQMIIRLHHRSGAFGLYNAGNTGSNNLGVGFRILF